MARSSIQKRTLDTYVAAATRENTRKSYKSAIRHFEQSWGGMLPASAESVARYLVDHAHSLAYNTLRQRMAALAQWHQLQGFFDPTKDPLVRKTLRGIRALHPSKEKQAAALTMPILERVCKHLEKCAKDATADGDRPGRLRALRDKSLFLLGFWRAFRGDELTRLTVEHISITPGVGMTCYLSQTKTDRDYAGTSFKVPVLGRLCPVQAYLDWIEAAHLTDGPVYRGVNQWGQIKEKPLHVDSIIPLLRDRLIQIGVDNIENFSSHSMRRGFATWASRNGWDVKTLMTYVGWKTEQSALRYVEEQDPFSQEQIKKLLPVKRSRIKLDT